MRFGTLVSVAVLATAAVGAPASTGHKAPIPERTVLYWMPDHELLPARLSAATWRASGVTALLVPSFGFEAVNGPLTDDRIQSHLNAVTQAADGMPVYLGVTLSHQVANPRGGEIPYPWSDGIQWSRLEDNLRRLAAECERRGVRGLLLDGEGYGQSPGYPFGYQDPLYCYRAPARGERGLPRKRGAELAQALRAGGPSLVLGAYFGHQQELGTPSCRPFWRGFFSAAGRNALYIYEDSYGAFADFRYARFNREMRSYYQCPRAIPAWWAATGAADVPGWFHRAQPQLQRAMDVSSMLMVYQDQQLSAPPGCFFSADPVWSSTLAGVLRAVGAQAGVGAAAHEAAGAAAPDYGDYRKKPEGSRTGTDSWTAVQRIRGIQLTRIIHEEITRWARDSPSLSPSLRGELSGLGQPPARTRAAALLQFPQRGGPREVDRQVLFQAQDLEDPVNTRVTSRHHRARAVVRLRLFHEGHEEAHPATVNKLDSLYLNNQHLRPLLEHAATRLRDGTDRGRV